MKNLRTPFKFIFILIFFSNVVISDDIKRILFVGNSYFYYNDSLHNHTESLLIEYYEDEEFLKAQNLFELIINNLRGKVEAEKVYFYYSYTHFYLNRFVLASYYFKNFTTTFPNSTYREEAEFMIGYSNYNLSPSYRLDQTYSAKAIEQFQLFVNTYPTSERVAECNKLIDIMRRKMEKKAFAEGELYYDLRQYQAATSSFKNLLKDYPEPPDAERVRFLILKGNYLLAQNSVFIKQTERYNDTLEYYKKFIKVI